MSTANLSDAQIDEYVNTFVLYDFPSHLRLFKLHQTFTWYTQPNIDVYDASSSTAGLTDFEQTQLSFNDPVYIAGFQVLYSQSRNQFFSQFPFNNSIIQVATGDGVTTDFTGTLSAVPVLRNNVNFVSQTAAGAGLRLSDNGAGVLAGDAGGGANTINYITGAFAISYSSAPAAGQGIFAETVPYQAAQPTALLYYDGQFTIRPVPDKVYPVNIEVYIRPAELLAAGQEPELEQWWQYIAYGAAKKVFEDRMDMESVQLIMPEFKMQERLVLRRTIMQNTNERVSTIYTENVAGGYGAGWFSGGGSF
jgi:hypothetical protein